MELINWKKSRRIEDKLRTLFAEIPKFEKVEFQMENSKDVKTSPHFYPEPEPITGCGCGTCPGTGVPG